MAKELTKEQWIEILSDQSTTKSYNLDVFQYLYASDNHAACASVIGRSLGIQGSRPGSPINLRIGELARRIAKKYDIDFDIRITQKYKFWNLFFNGWDEANGFFMWQLKPNLVDALEELNSKELAGEQFDEAFENESFIEGRAYIVTQTRYERDQNARRKCIEKRGTICEVCGFDFQKTYGKLGRGFIQVHHLNSLSAGKGVRETDPIKDLRPVCPNCHAMLHRGSLTIDELRALLKT